MCYLHNSTKVSLPMTVKELFGLFAMASMRSRDDVLLCRNFRSIFSTCLCKLSISSWVDMSSPSEIGETKYLTVVFFPVTVISLKMALSCQSISPSMASLLGGQTRLLTFSLELDFDKSTFKLRLFILQFLCYLL